MKSLYGNIRLRPIRIALLVRPTDTKSIRKFMRYNACLWGGRYNSIIPVTRQLPNAWKRRYGRPSGIELAKRYIHFFEPDVYLEAEKGLAEKLGLHDDILNYGHDRVLSLDKFFSAEDEYSTPTFKFGQNIFDVYRKLHDKEFKFVTKREQKFTMISKRGDAFFEAAHGCFPDDKEFDYIQKAYNDVFSPEILEASYDTSRKIIEEQLVTPLRLTRYKIEEHYYNRSDPKIFVFDPTEPTDLIDFWNFRIFENGVWPVNVHWFDKSADLIVEDLTRNYRPLPRNPYGVMITTKIEFGEAIPEDKSKEIMDTYIVGKAPEGACSYKTWYTPIWEDRSDQPVSHPHKVNLKAEQEYIELIVNEESEKTASMQTLSPDFANEYRSLGRYRWANVLKFGSRFLSENLACCFPPKIKAKDFPRLARSTPTLTSREGIVILNEYLRDEVFLDMMTGDEAFIKWLKSKDTEAEISQAGHTTQQIISSLGGLWGIKFLAHKEIIELLNKMADKEARRSDENEEVIKEHEGKTAKPNSWTTVLNSINRKKCPIRELTLDDFTKRNVLRLGFFIACEHCQKNNWYDLKEIDYTPQCERCLKEFDFPQADISRRNDLFRYRVIGPFATPRAADGGYATALTLRLFSATLDIGDNRLTYTTGLKFKSENNMEVDFALWYERDRILGDNHNVDIVFGESKSFAYEGFKEDDLKRMYRLAELFPGSYMVFSSLKDELSKKEKQLIGKFASWGRKRTSDGRARAHIIILTGHELFTELYVSETWKNLGGKHKKLIEPAYVRLENLDNLANFTQQLYLGSEPINLGDS